MFMIIVNDQDACYYFQLKHIMINAGLDEAQAGIKTAGKNIDNFRYVMTPPLRQKVKRN